MSQPLRGVNSGRGARSMALRERPTGWPVGSFGTYEQAQQAVDKLSDAHFPVQDLTIVGVNLMEVERVTGRLTWGRVIASGAASGAWMGVFFGLLLGIFTQAAFVSVMALGIIMGAIFGIVMTAVPYAISGGQRDFTSATQIVAGRYDVLCNPETAPRARDAIARMGIAGGVDKQEPAAPQISEEESEEPRPEPPVEPRGLHYGQTPPQP